MVLPPPPLENGTCDMFLDDGDAVVLDEGDNVLQAQVGTSRSGNVLSCPIYQEYIPRDPMLEKEKLEKGRPKEIQVVLGWTTNTRALQASLPYAKQRAWDKDINQLIEAGGTNCRDLRKMLGRLNHAATVLPLARLYLGRFYAKLKRFRNDFYSIDWNASY
jgi:hypothetical protein